MIKYEIIKEQEISMEDRIVAASRLSGPAFKIYCYLEGNLYYLRPFISNFFNLSPKTVDKAFNELIEKKYVQQISSSQIKFNGKK